MSKRADLPAQPVDRRGFITSCACALAAGGLLHGCASLNVRQVSPVRGALLLPLLQHPELLEAGGVLTVQPEGMENPVIISAFGDNRFIALSPICTHLGCTVDVEGEHLVCPCHGSTYDREGRVLRGPAEEPLSKFATSLTSDGVLRVDLTRTTQ